MPKSSSDVALFGLKIGTSECRHQEHFRRSFYKDDAFCKKHLSARDIKIPLEVVNFLSGQIELTSCERLVVCLSFARAPAN